MSRTRSAAGAGRAPPPPPSRHVSREASRGGVLPAAPGAQFRPSSSAQPPFSASRSAVRTLSASVAPRAPSRPDQGVRDQIGQPPGPCGARRSRPSTHSLRPSQRPSYTSGAALRGGAAGVSGGGGARRDSKGGSARREYDTGRYSSRYGSGGRRSGASGHRERGESPSRRHSARGGRREREREREPPSRTGGRSERRGGETGGGSRPSKAQGAYERRRVSGAQAGTLYNEPERPRWYNRPSPPLRPDDEDGHYVFELGENLSPRYKILNKLGEGTFGRVLECVDREDRRRVAIKIIRNVPKYRDAAMLEVEALGALKRHDPRSDKGCVHLLRWFEYRGHVCMVFECLGLSLFDFLHKNRYRPFPLPMVRAFGRQLLEAVAFMHELTLIHTDLKPENVLLVSPEYSKFPCPHGSKSSYRVPDSPAIKLIDFGSATFERQHHSRVVSTRHYRAPEVILGHGWSYPCDVWSIGCILVELLTGDALFQTHDNLEHLAMMQQVLGRMDPLMAAKCDRATGTQYFRDFGKGSTPAPGGPPRAYKLDWPARDGRSSLEGERAVRRMRPLEDIVRGALGTEPVCAPRELQEGAVALLKGLLRYNPADRMSARQALAHPFFAEAPSIGAAGGGACVPHGVKIGSGGVGGGSSGSGGTGGKAGAQQAPPPRAAVTAAAPEPSGGRKRRAEHDQPRAPPPEERPPEERGGYGTRSARRERDAAAATAAAAAAAASGGHHDTRAKRQRVDERLAPPPSARPTRTLALSAARGGATAAEGAGKRVAGGGAAAKKRSRSHGA